MPKVRAGQMELNVVDRGRGMPIVMVHGFPLDHTMWAAQIGALGQRYRVIAPDLRGFGGSQVVAGVATMEQMADDLAAMCDSLKINEPIVLCGLSMGGYVAFQFWKKYAARLKALVLCDTRSVADTPEGAAGRHKMAEQTIAQGAAPIAEAMFPKLFAPQTLAEQSPVIEQTRQVILSNSPEGIAAALRGMAVRPNMTPELPNIALPTLVIVGEHDAISSVEEMRGLAQAIPGSQFVAIPAAGHMAPLERPDDFQAAIEPFLARLERGG